MVQYDTRLAITRPKRSLKHLLPMQEHVKNNRGGYLGCYGTWQACQNYQNRMWFKKVTE